jgi:hypothetical protein
LTEEEVLLVFGGPLAGSRVALARRSRNHRVNPVPCHRKLANALGGELRYVLLCNRNAWMVGAIGLRCVPITIDR